ncbi:MAG: hypothetical protein ACFFKA_20430, partial [Candidatus Thorarchaeota archaeon]
MLIKKQNVFRFNKRLIITLTLLIVFISPILIGSINCNFKNLRNERVDSYSSLQSSSNSPSYSRSSSNSPSCRYSSSLASGAAPNDASP